MNYDDMRKEKMEALKAKDTVKNSVVTMLLSGMTYKKKEVGRDLTEAECLEVISKELKQVRESLDMAQGRPDAAEELRRQITILEGYLPKQMSAEEVEAAVRQLATEQGLELTVKNKGQVMKAVMGQLKGKADGKVISSAVDSLLQ